MTDKKTIRAASRAEFQRNYGAICPWCRSDKIVLLDMVNSSTGVDQKAACHECDARWIILYMPNNWMVR